MTGATTNTKTASSKPEVNSPSRESAADSHWSWLAGSLRNSWSCSYDHRSALIPMRAMSSSIWSVDCRYRPGKSVTSPCACSATEGMTSHPTRTSRPTRADQGEHRAERAGHPSLLQPVDHRVEDVDDGDRQDHRRHQHMDPAQDPDHHPNERQHPQDAPRRHPGTGQRIGDPHPCLGVGSIGGERHGHARIRRSRSRRLRERVGHRRVAGGAGRVGHGDEPATSGAVHGRLPPASAAPVPTARRGTPGGDHQPDEPAPHPVGDLRQPRLAHAQQSSHGERGVLQRRRIVHQPADRLVVAGGAHAQRVPDGGVLRPGVEPPRPLEVEDTSGRAPTVRTLPERRRRPDRHRCRLARRARSRRGSLVDLLVHGLQAIGGV